MQYIGAACSGLALAVVMLGGCASDQRAAAPSPAPQADRIAEVGQQATRSGDGLTTIQRRVNRFTASAQDHATVALGRGGDLIVAWDSRRQQDGTSGIYARRLDQLARPITDETRINLQTQSMQAHPALAADADGSIWCAWDSFAQDGDGWGVVLRRLDPDLSGGSAEIAVNQTRSGDQASPGLAIDQSGHVLVTWTSQAGPDSTVMARLFGPDGKPITPEVRLTPADRPGRDRLGVPASLARDGHGGFVVVWSRSDERGRPIGLIAHRLDAQGRPAGGEIIIADGDSGAPVEPSIASNGDRLIVAWMAAQGPGYGVRARWFEASLQPIGREIPIATPGSGTTSGVSVSLDPRGGAVVAYNRMSDDPKGDLVAVRIDSDGRILGRIDPATSSIAGPQRLAQASTAARTAIGPGGHLILAWSGDSEQGDKSAANVSVRLPTALAQRLAAKAPEPVPADPSPTEDRVAGAGPTHQPPTWDPNFKPQEPLVGVRGSGPDFGFEGVPGTGWIPPDPEMAVGRDQIVLVTNGQIRFMDKGGSTLFQDMIEGFGGFWGSLGAGGFVFDPEVHYDPLVDRFWAMASERTGGRSFFLLAVSDDGNPVGTWHKYRFDVTSLAGSDIDSPNLAFDDRAVYLTADFFSPRDKYLIFIVNKAPMLSGGVPGTRSMLITGQQSIGLPVTLDAGAPAQYMIESTELSANGVVRFHAIQDPLGTPTRVTTTLTVPTYLFPGSPPQMGTSVSPFLFEPRFWSCMYRNGSLWAVHHIRRPGQSRTVARWYEFAMNGWPDSGAEPSIAQWGEIDAGGQTHVFFPSIAADENGNAAITMARSSSSEFISIWRSVRRAEDPPGTFGPMVLVKQSTAPDTSGRWGDYSATQADEFDPCRFWGHHEWRFGGSWRTWVARYDDFSPADLTRDCTLDVGDFFAFVAAFAAGDPAADINGDGLVDVRDFFAFISLFA